MEHTRKKKNLQSFFSQQQKSSENLKVSQVKQRYFPNFHLALTLFLLSFFFFVVK